MKLPYIKIYTADLLAAGRHLTTEQVGDAVLGICEEAFENDTAYQPQSRHEQALYDMLTHWKEEAKEGYLVKKRAGRKGGQTTQRKNKQIDASKPLPSASSTPSKQTDTDTETETDTETKTETETNTETKTETENIITTAPSAQGRGSLLPRFAAHVLACFEPEVQTPAQKRIWYKRNVRCLKDILEFCGQDTVLALQTIHECLVRLEKAGLSGGYEAVCRHLPEYYAQALVHREDSQYANLNA